MGEEDTYADVIRFIRPEQIPTGQLRQYSIEEWAREFQKRVSDYSKISHELKEFGIPFGGRVLLVGPPGTDFEAFVSYLAAEMPINLISFRLSELIGKQQDMIDVIRVGFETARRHSPSLLYLERLDFLALETSPESVVLCDELRETSWDNNETLVVSSVHDLRRVDREILTLFNQTYSASAASAKDRMNVFELTLQTRNDLDIRILTEITEGWSFAEVKYLAVNLYMSPPNNPEKIDREHMEHVLSQSRVTPIHTISGLGSIFNQKTGNRTLDIEAVDKMYPDDFVDQLYLMAVGDDYSQTQRVIETLNANLPLSNDEREFLSRYPFLLSGTSENRLTRLLKAKRSSDRLNRIMGRL